ncbi:DEAD/DEAH box helicase [Thermococcus sp. GR7]|uniref:helicase C-terminal domain-containing protein n=1 Tax=unclassified Thermococcus TaxID=2627626 RepID=UPI001430052E|nr:MULTISPECIES: helicase C-terminal domain-containing protein [unclassified Thermococcus]NJE47814.1 DEAD/DEAH box helicase [Thermococcus sp. GR7]NJE79176.1 DEAD/DEAH box helicase [Thermococcus sp. GR4]NJF23425.1 DEAD/DEAH box helicase [Thermococcus sp. GR5]
MSEYFPYESLRPHQREFIELVNEAVKNGENAIIEAPTGFGKTVSVLAGILPYAIERGYKVLYLARTHRQMDRVIEELKAINRKTPISGVELRSRKDLCLHSYLTQFTTDAYNAMVVCKNLKKLGKCPFYENEKKKKTEFDELIKFFLQEPSHPMEILDYAQTLELCPYDLTRRIAEKANVIVASYLYLLSPTIRENFLSSLDIDYSDLIVVFDEAHNLPDQAISALSDRLSIHTVNRAIKEADEYREHEIANFLSIFGKGLEMLYEEKLRERDVHEVPIQPGLVFAHVVDILNLDGRYLVKTLNEMAAVGDSIREDRIEKGKPPRSYIGRVGEFLLFWLSLIGREDYLFLMSRDKGLSLELVALDPSKALSFVKNVQSAIFMSGTLTPLEAFRDVMGIENAKLKKFPRMVKRENAQVLVAKDVSTRGEERSMEVYKRMVDYIVEAVKLIPKNVGVFTASYEVLQGLLSANLEVRLEGTGKAIFIEKQGATSQENDLLVAKFKAHARGKGAVLLGVMGGRNSEGQDYSGDEMNGVILVGIPYARPTPRVQAQIRYFERKFPGKGRYYGYYLPAHRKLVQAAGRVHRSAEEKGSIIVLDYRLLWKGIKKDLPDWMRETMRPVDLGRMRLYLRRFWQQPLRGKA